MSLNTNPHLPDERPPQSGQGHRVTMWCAVPLFAMVVLAGCQSGGIGPSAQIPRVIPQQPVSSENIAELVVPVDQLAGRPALAGMGPTAVSQEPVSVPAVSCAGKLSDDAGVFGQDFLAFRSVTYASGEGRFVVQDIAVYGSSQEADERFAFAVSAARSCSEPGAPEVAYLGEGVIRWAPESRSSTELRVQDNVLAKVTVVGIDTAVVEVGEVSSRIAFNVRLRAD